MLSNLVSAVPFGLFEFYVCSTEKPTSTFTLRLLARKREIYYNKFSITLELRWRKSFQSWVGMNEKVERELFEHDLMSVYLRCRFVSRVFRSKEYRSAERIVMKRILLKFKFQWWRAENIPSRPWWLFWQQRHFRTAKGFHFMIKMYNLWRKEQNFPHKFMNFKVSFRSHSFLCFSELKSNWKVFFFKKKTSTQIQNCHSQWIQAYRSWFWESSFFHLT